MAYEWKHGWKHGREYLLNEYGFILSQLVIAYYLLSKIELEILNCSHETHFSYPSLTNILLLTPASSSRSCQFSVEYLRLCEITRSVYV